MRPDGAWVTAGAIDRALEPVAALRLYQANQRTPERVEVDVVADADVAQEVQDRLAPLCEGLEVSARMATGIAGEPSGKYRASRRTFPLDLTRAFEGCLPSGR